MDEPAMNANGTALTSIFGPTSRDDGKPRRETIPGKSFFVSFRLHGYQSVLRSNM
jgi:hypothetical protein